jgi:sulfhydrogenase subunit beta (sulfur reductase)
VDAESCWCDLLGVDPYPTEGFDLNLSPVKDGYVVEAATAQGERLVTQDRELFSDASETQLAERERNRKAIKEKLAAKNERFRTVKPMTQIMQEAVNSEDWDQFARLCVECGACTAICPTCHCFYLFDRLRQHPTGGKHEYARVREWDSCLFADYARMAGREAGKPNPRPRLRSRLENRFAHKYLHMPRIYGTYGCTGCGRCFDACLGGIDPREVIKKLEKKPG